MQREAQVRNGKRVRDLGEVFTQAKDVRAMVDMCSAECLKVASRVLEPSCGTCNFLVEILKRKFEDLDAKGLGVRGHQFYQQALLAMATMYGIDISPKNIRESRRILEDAFRSETRRRTGRALPVGVERALKAILRTNLMLADTLNPSPKTLLFEYLPVGAASFARKVHVLRDILRGKAAEQGDLLTAPAKVQELPAVEYWRLAEAVR